MNEFIKHGSRRQIAFEAAGLTDLADCGAAVAELLWTEETSLATRMVEKASPTPEAAREFGSMLAALHGHGSDRVFGQAPPGFDVVEHGGGTMGDEFLPVISAEEADKDRAWGEFYAEDRLLPYLDSSLSNGSIDSAGDDIIHRLAERLRDGEFDTDDEPSVLHGDLWSGNVMWSPEGAVLIDPASHTGHRESDLAQLTVFGVPHYEQIIEGYEQTTPLSDGWRDRVGLHQLHILIIHASLFGGGYGSQTVNTAKKYL